MEDGLYLYHIQSRSEPAFVFIKLNEKIYKMMSSGKVYLTSYDDSFLQEYEMWRCDMRRELYQDYAYKFILTLRRNEPIEIDPVSGYKLLDK